MKAVIRTPCRTTFLKREHAKYKDNLMPQPNSTWRVNYQGMERCCRMALEHEMYRRGLAKEPLMAEGDTINCLNCNAKMIFDPSLKDGRLRWRWKANG